MIFEAVSGKLQEIVLKSAQAYFKEMKWEESKNKLNAKAMNKIKDSEVQEEIAACTSETTAKMLDSIQLSDSFIDELFEEYYEVNVKHYNKKEVKKHFKLYMDNVNQALCKELDTAQRLIHKNITLQSDMIRRKVDKESKKINKGLDEIKEVSERNALEIKEKQEKSTLNIIEKIGEVGLPKVPLLSINEGQSIIISLCNEYDTKYNIFANTVVLDGSLQEDSEYASFAIELLVNNISAVAIEKIKLLDFQFNFYEMVEDDAQSFYGYTLADFNKPIQFYKSILSSSSAKLKIVAHDNNIGDGTFYSYDSPYKEEDKESYCNYEYCEDRRNHLRSMQDIIIEFTLQINENIDYEVQIFATRYSGQRYLEGYYKIDYAFVGMKK